MSGKNLTAQDIATAGELRSYLTVLLGRVYAMQGPAQLLEHFLPLHAPKGRAERIVRWRTSQFNDSLAILQASFAHCVALAEDAAGTPPELPVFPVAQETGERTPLHQILSRALTRIDTTPVRIELNTLRDRLADEPEILPDDELRAALNREMFIAMLNAKACGHLLDYLIGEARPIVEQLRTPKETR